MAATRSPDGGCASWRLYVLPILLTVVAPSSVAQDAARQTADVRALFLEVERAASLPPDAQLERLPRLYREACAQLDNPRFIAALAWTAFSTAAAAGETVEDLADRLERQGRWPWLAEAGRRRCHEVLDRHRERVQSLARADLKGDSAALRDRALRVAGSLKLVGLYEEVAAALGGPESEMAAYALRDMDDPRAIPLLIRVAPERPTEHFEILRSLQRNRPAHPMLLNLLGSGDVKVRWQAAYALSESRDPALVPIVERLTRDDLLRLYREFAASIIETLESLGLQYAIGGSFASSTYGEART